MAEQLFKLSPHRDLQCYFLTPSAVAAMSGASETGFALSGKWRQQFDWAVVEWNRDNVFEHPAVRYLPDGDLSGLTLTYQETRTNCIPIESNLVPVVDWNNLRIWAPSTDGLEEWVYHVDLAPLATPVSANGSSAVPTPASATMTLVTSPGATNRVGLACLEEHYYYTVGANDSLQTIAAGIATNVNQVSQLFTATSSGPSVTLTWAPRAGQNPAPPNLDGSNGNRIAVYGFSDGGPQVWQQMTAQFGGGAFPAWHQISIDFGALSTDYYDDPHGNRHQLLTPISIPTNNARKVRWTWSADIVSGPGSFEQKEFEVQIQNWTVTGNNRIYSVAGPGSRRVENDDASVVYSAQGWATEGPGNYSGSTISATSQPGATCSITYSETAPHQLYLGTRMVASGSTVSIAVDGQALQPALNLAVTDGEDVLIRHPLGTYGAGSHTVGINNLGSADFYFDFLEIAYPSQDLPDFPSQPQLTLATDWDTYHSQSLPAERTAWIINKLGFHGRLYHYTGALWFYELVRTGTQYASATVTLTGQLGNASKKVVLDIIPDDGTAANATQISHLILSFDTDTTVAAALAALINVGSNLVWASTNGNQLTLTARAMGTLGNGITVTLDQSSQGYTLSPSSATLTGGVDGTPFDLNVASSTYDKWQSLFVNAAACWRTDLTATPRINRAARDWHQAYFTALKGYGIDAVASFSTELGNGDTSAQTGIAQRRWDGTPVVLNTPSVQTNFSPASLAFWKQVYLDMAALQKAAGMVPYLCSGEVQWWYFPYNVSGEIPVSMPFYDAYTQQQFQAKYGMAMQEIVNPSSPDFNLAQYPNEIAFLPTLIGAYTAAIRSALQAQFPGCRYEVLYPTDTNYNPYNQFNQLINFPNSDWTPTNLTCLKTESFGFTGARDLNHCLASMDTGATKSFPNSQRSHLIGISDATTPWMKEADLAESQGLESVVLFALDQFCLIGYPVPPVISQNRSQMQG